MWKTRVHVFVCVELCGNFKISMWATHLYFLPTKQLQFKYFLSIPLYSIPFPPFLSSHPNTHFDFCYMRSTVLCNYKFHFICHSSIVNATVQDLLLGLITHISFPKPHTHSLSLSSLIAMQICNDKFNGLTVSFDNFKQPHFFSLKKYTLRFKGV